MEAREKILGVEGTLRQPDRPTTLILTAGLLILLLCFLRRVDLGPEGVASALPVIACELIFTAAHGMVCEDHILELQVRNSRDQQLLTSPAAIANSGQKKGPAMCGLLC